MSRTTVGACIQSLSHDARVDAEKCTPRCLRRLYQDTRAALQAMLMEKVEQEVVQYLGSEQRINGWEDTMPIDPAADTMEMHLTH